MKQIIILLSLFIPIYANNLYRKCCPLNEVIKIENDDKFSCITSNFTVSEIINFTSFDNNLSTCDGDIQVINIKDINGLDGNETCVDIIDEDQLAIVQCSIKISKASLSFGLQKCCESDMIYDDEQRKCVENENLENSVFTEILIESYGVPKCPKEVIVIYYSENSKIIFNNYSVKIDDRKISTSFCIDETISGKILVKVCESHEICSKIPCFRKCCDQLEKFYYSEENETSSCVEHNEDFIHPNFYSFTIGDDLSQIPSTITPSS